VAGLAVSVFELDYRFHRYDAATVADMGYEGGKMLLRIDSPIRHRSDHGCVRTSVGRTAGRRRMAMVEPVLRTGWTASTCSWLGCDIKPCNRRGLGARRLHVC